MKLKTSVVLVLCALVAVVCGCGATAEPGPSQEGTDVVAVTLEEHTNSIDMKFKLIPAGEFMMGSPKNEEDRGYGEAQHRVRITKPYYIGVTEVTQGQWEEVMGTRPWERGRVSKSNPKHAVSCVSWDDAVEFCRKLSEEEGREYRLPTEAQWEHACRAGTTTRFSFGDDDSALGAYAWCFENTYAVGEIYAHEVGLKSANAYGLFDMHGNVNEWCQDRYEVDYFEYSPIDDPAGPSTVMRGGHRVEGEEWDQWDRVVRGGGGMGSKDYYRSASRGGCEPDYHNDERGFRVALDPAE